MVLRLYIFIFLLSFSKIKSQELTQHKLDSVKQKFISDSTRIFRQQRFRPYANIDFRNTFIRSKKVPLNGFQIGVTFKERHSFAIGGYRLYSRFDLKFRKVDSLNSATESIRMRYATFFYQYVLFDKRFIEIDLPFEVGYGSFSVARVDSISKRLLPPEKDPIALAGLGAQLVIKPTRWIGLSTLIGYRFVRESFTFNQFSKLDGFYYSLGLWVDIRQVVRDVRFYGFVRRKYRKNLKRISDS